MKKNNTAYNALHSDYRYYNHVTPGDLEKVFNAVIIQRY